MIGHDAVGQDVQTAELGVGIHPVDELFLLVGTEDEPAVHHPRDAVVVRLADSRIELQTGLAHARKVGRKVSMSIQKTCPLVFISQKSPRWAGLRLLGVFDLGHFDLHRAVFFLHFAGNSDFLGGGAEVIVMIVLADFADEPVGLGLVAFLDFQDILALVGLVQTALEALAFAGEGDFLGSEDRGAVGESRDNGELEGVLHSVDLVCIR